MRLLRPFVDELGKIPDVPERLSRFREERRSRRLDVIEPHQLALLAFEIGHFTARQRLERPHVSRLWPARALGNASLLSPIAGQKHDNPIRFAQLVSAQDQGVSLVDRHIAMLNAEPGMPK